MPTTPLVRRKWTVCIGGRPFLGFESESAVDIDDEPEGLGFGFVGSDPVIFDYAELEAREPAEESG